MQNQTLPVMKHPRSTLTGAELSLAIFGIFTISCDKRHLFHAFTPLGTHTDLMFLNLTCFPSQEFNFLTWRAVRSPILVFYSRADILCNKKLSQPLPTKKTTH